MKKARTAITPTRSEDYPKWYQEVIKAAELAESSSVRGCMVIKPWGYAIWENIQKILDQKIKESGHKNFYCPLFVPLSFLEKEAEHVSGFATECAVVTHHRLEKKDDGKLHPAAKLEEPLIVRPTSEAIIGDVYSNWIQSYRDLPLKLNQWANVVRWEMRPRLFLRTSEFLWQEGHTVHATSNEAVDETLEMLEMYADVLENYLAVPVVKGEKTDGEKFPGAENTYTIESMMQDKKALQSGTSHYFGQKFAKAFDISFLDEKGKNQHGWTTSWGVTTRLIGGLIMAHSDDDGLILPPNITPIHIVILPLIKNEEDREKVLAYCQGLAALLQDLSFGEGKLKVEIDLSDKRPGDKNWAWVKKGVPMRVEIGMKEIEQQAVCLARRDESVKDKRILSKDLFLQTAVSMLSNIQQTLYARAKSFKDSNTVEIFTKEALYDFFAEDKPGGFAIVPWIETKETEELLRKDLKITARCKPLYLKDKIAPCIFTGKDAPLVIFAKAY